MKILSIIICLCLAHPLWGTELVGALSAGMGGTGRAGVEAPEALYLNPAGMALLDRFYSGISYQSGFTEAEVSRNIYSITMVDATKGLLFPGAFGYRRHKVSDGGFQYNENEFRGGLGYRASERLSFGFGASYLKAESQNGRGFRQRNLDLGMLVGLTPNWGLSFSGENLLKPDEEIPLALVRPSRVSMGTQYIFRRLVTLRYEALMPLHIENTNLLGHRVGLGVGMRGSFTLNGGFSVDDARSQNWTSVGLAWKGPRLKLAYGFQSESRSGLGTRHLIDLWMDL